MDEDQKLSMGELRVDGEMTIYRATEVAQTSVRRRYVHMTGDVNHRILSDVTEFDTAGLQLVLVARRMVEANGSSPRRDAAERVNRPKYSGYAASPSTMILSAGSVMTDSALPYLHRGKPRVAARDGSCLARVRAG